MRHLLSIAGSDPSGGAGIQADLKTFSALGAYGMTAICALTAQNTQGVVGYEAVGPAMVRAQIDAIFADIHVDAVKIGMLANEGVARAVAASLRQHGPAVVVLDPVMVSKSGHRLLDEGAVRALVDEVLPLATVLTPNLPEARDLLLALCHEGCGVLASRLEPVTSTAASLASELWKLTGRAVLLKGGHSGGPSSDDILAWSGGLEVYHGERLEALHTHGTGCSLSSALAVFLARGLSLGEAVRAAKAWVRMGIAEGLAVGKGCGPIHHYHEFYDTEGARR